MNGRKMIPGKPVPASEVPEYTIHRDTLMEIFSDAFLDRMRRIHAIVRRSHEPLEGNIFYPISMKNIRKGRRPTSRPGAQKCLARGAIKDRLLEVGVNAGHGALLALSSNPRLEYYGVDIMTHGYTIECVDFLKGEFPGRVHLFSGNSREVLPWLADRRDELNFDIIHVDGGHTSEVCLSDVTQSIRMGRGLKGRHLLLDDVHASWIFDIYCEFVARGDLTTETFFGDWEEAGRNVLARIE